MAANLGDCRALWSPGQSLRLAPAVFRLVRPGKKSWPEGSAGPLNSEELGHECGAFDVLYYSIHFYDVSRFLHGEPEWVYSICGKWPGQALKGETRTSTLLEYPGGLQLSHRTNHNNHAGDTYARFRVEGSEGVAKGTFGIHYGYPHGRTDEFSFITRQ